MKGKDLYQAIFGEQQQQEKYKMVPHSFQRIVGGKQVCSKCGLIALNNKFSVWALEKGCYNDLHPDYKKNRKLPNKGEI